MDEDIVANGGYGFQVIKAGESYDATETLVGATYNGPPIALAVVITPGTMTVFKDTQGNSLLGRLSGVAMPTHCPISFKRGEEGGVFTSGTAVWCLYFATDNEKPAAV